jgi:hypothetical protein
MKSRIDDEKYWNGFFYGSIVGIFAGIAIDWLLITLLNL